MVLDVCSKCHHRKYCGRDCQKADWTCGHKHWCGNAGEIDFDYEIRESDGKGLGVFALRRFERGEKVMAERGFAQSDIRRFPLTVTSAIQALVPRASNKLSDKFLINAIGTGDCFPSSEHHIFVNMSRVNHHCVGNSDHFYISQHKVAILPATRTIVPGDEVTFSYIDYMTHPEVYDHMFEIWKFRSDCSACTTSITRRKLLAIKKLDGMVLSMGMLGRFDEAIEIGNRLLGIYHELQYSLAAIYRTYYDMFQMAVARKRTLKQARTYIAQALHFAVLMYGDIDIPEVQSLRLLAENPSEHSNFGIGDR